MDNIFAQNHYYMESTTSTSKYWLWFFIWLAILIIMLCDIGGFTRKFFWLALPGTVTYFSKAMKLM